MGELRNSRTARLSLAGVARPAGSDPLLQAVREAAGRDFAVLGEIGRGPDGTVAYLARDTRNERLLALRCTPTGASDDYVLDLAGDLDQTVPAPPSSCPKCGAGVRSWARFCTRCGVNLWSDRAVGGQWAKADLLAALKQATGGRYEILGEMERPGGKGVVYFARDTETDKIEALRLEQEGARDFSVGLTGVLHRFAGAIATQRPSRDR